MAIADGNGRGATRWSPPGAAGHGDPGDDHRDPGGSIQEGVRDGKDLTVGKRRPLTPGEIDLLGSLLFEDSVDYGLIRLRKGGPLTQTGSWVTIDNTVFVPKKCWLPDYSPLVTPVLFHEVTHVWQYQHRKHPRLRNYRWFLALQEQLRYGAQVYDYDYRDHDRLTEFRFEQQGKIVQDYMSGFPSHLVELIRRDIPNLGN